MSALLKGRFGYYKPRNADERTRARKQVETRRQHAANAAAWLDRTRWCVNGCGKEAARYEGPGLALRFDGCCSTDCQTALEQHEARPSAV